jgi:hypothetical protein
MQLFGQSKQPGELVQGGIVGLVRLLHEFAKLKMYADNVSTQFLNLSEVFFYLGPFCIPIVFEELALFIVVVVESPRHKPATFLFENECAPVLRDSYPFHLARYPLGLSHGYQAAENPKKQ